MLTPNFQHFKASLSVTTECILETLLTEVHEEMRPYSP